MEIKWIDGSTIQVKIEEGTTIISANKEGLLSLADQLSTLAQDTSGSHIHYDEYNSLEDGSSQLIIEKQ